MNIINQTKNGRVYICNQCQKVHLEFQNVGFKFSQNHWNEFVKYISEIDGEDIENRNRFLDDEKKIHIPIMNDGFKLRLDQKDLSELKYLVNKKINPAYQTIKSKKYNFEAFLN